MIRSLFAISIFLLVVPPAALAANPPVGAVTGWLKSLPGTPALSTDWVECNGQVLADSDSPFDGQAIPDLNGASETQRFLRGAVTSGTTGGSSSHLHTLPNTTQVQAQPVTQAAVSVTGATSHLPDFYEVVWVMRVKETTTSAAPAVSPVGLLGLAMLLLAAGGMILRRRGFPGGPVPA